MTQFAQHSAEGDAEPPVSATPGSIDFNRRGQVNHRIRLVMKLLTELCYTTEIEVQRLIRVSFGVQKEYPTEGLPLIPGTVHYSWAID